MFIEMVLLFAGALLYFLLKPTGKDPFEMTIVPDETVNTFAANYAITAQSPVNQQLAASGYNYQQHPKNNGHPD